MNALPDIQGPGEQQPPALPFADAELGAALAPCEGVCSPESATVLYVRRVLETHDAYTEGVIDFQLMQAVIAGLTLAQIRERAH